MRDFEREEVKQLVCGLFSKRICGHGTPKSKIDYDGAFPVKEFVETAELPRQNVEIKFNLDGKPRIFTFDVKDADEALAHLERKLGDDIHKIENPRINSQMISSQSEHQRVWKIFLASFTRAWAERPRVAA